MFTSVSKTRAGGRAAVGTASGGCVQLSVL